MNEPQLTTDSAIMSATDTDIGSREFFQRARTRLGFEVPAGLTDAAVMPTSGDEGTDRMWRIIAQEQPVRPAAVLIGVVAHADPTVMLTLRAAHLNDHAGQIAFPGGKIDAADASPLDAALREAEEEIGLPPPVVQLIGIADRYRTITGFEVTPRGRLAGKEICSNLDLIAFSLDGSTLPAMIKRIFGD